MTSPAVRPVILLPADPLGSKIGGIRTFVEGFVAHAPADFEVTIVGVSEVSKTPLRREASIELGGREVGFLPLLRVPDPNRRRRVPLAASYAFRLLQHRERLPLDRSVIQVHRPGTELATLGMRAPKVRFIHTDVASAGSESRWRRLSRVLELVEALTLRKMAAIYALSEELREQYARRYESLANRMKFVPNWFDERLFAVRELPERSRYREELGIGADEEVVLFVGRLEEQKNPLLLVDAVAMLLAVRPRVRLLVMGDGTLRHSVKLRARQHGIESALRMAGGVHRSEVARAMAAADVLCITSSFEAGPTVGFEALGSGLPVVASPVGQVSRVIAGKPAAGRIARLSPDPIADALACVLELPLSVRREAAAEAARPYRAAAVLAPIYEDHRRLVEEHEESP